MTYRAYQRRLSSFRESSDSLEDKRKEKDIQNFLMDEDGLFDFVSYMMPILYPNVEEDDDVFCEKSGELLSYVAKSIASFLVEKDCALVQDWKDADFYYVKNRMVFRDGGSPLSRRYSTGYLEGDIEYTTGEKFSIKVALPCYNGEGRVPCRKEHLKIIVD